MAEFLKLKKVKSFERFISEKHHLTTSCIYGSIFIDSMKIHFPLPTDIINDFLKTGLFPD